MVKFSIISVTYNSENYLEKFLTSIKKYLPNDTEVIIVDSGSQDGTVKILKQEKLKLIDIGENIGYGRGNNLAAKVAKGEYLFFLNPDTEILDNALNKLLRFAEHSSFGIIAPQLIEPSGSIQPSVRKLPTLLGAIKEFWFGKKSEFEAYAPSGQKETEVESVVGAAILIRRDYFLKLGGFDEKYFMYFEDLDLCRKVIRDSQKIIYLPSVKIKHLVGGSKEVKKGDWIRESDKIYFGPVKAYLIQVISRIGNKFQRHEKS